jgi:hypothetical protein
MTHIPYRAQPRDRPCSTVVFRTVLSFLISSGSAPAPFIGLVRNMWGTGRARS